MPRPTNLPPASAKGRAGGGHLSSRARGQNRTHDRDFVKIESNKSKTCYDMVSSIGPLLPRTPYIPTGQFCPQVLKYIYLIQYLGIRRYDLAIISRFWKRGLRMVNYGRFWPKTLFEKRDFFLINHVGTKFYVNRLQAMILYLGPIGHGAKKRQLVIVRMINYWQLSRFMCNLAEQ